MNQRHFRPLSEAQEDALTRVRLRGGVDSPRGLRRAMADGGYEPVVPQILSKIASTEAMGLRVIAIHLDESQYIAMLADLLVSGEQKYELSKEILRHDRGPSKVSCHLFGIPVYVYPRMDPLLVAAQKAALAEGETIVTV